TFSSALLGERALKCLNALELLGELSAEDLEQQWAKGVVAEWFAQTEEHRRDEALAELLEALASLDYYEGWRDARLPCLPSETGGWICRDEAKRFPPDWAVLTNEVAIRGALQVLMGDPSKIVRWSFDSYVQQPRSAGARYLVHIDPIKLEDLAEEWWESLPNDPNDSEVDLAVRFTMWVRAKQPQRRNLVRKLLAGVGDTATLLPTPEVLITDPYAESCRRIWFPDTPVAASDYLTADSTASPGDWRSFFESLSPAPKGRFSLRLTASSYSEHELRNFMCGSYDPPLRRATYKVVDWRGLSLSSYEYKVLDAHLPETMKQRLEGTDLITPEEGRAIAFWISESPAMFKECSDCRLAYIPYGSSSDS